MATKKTKSINPEIVAEKALKFLEDWPQARNIWVDVPRIASETNPLEFGIYAVGITRKDLMGLCIAIMGRSK